MQNPFTQPKKLKILVGMSGGVDSSLAAALLIEQGYEVTGGFIKNWSDSKDLWTGECQWRGERRDAMRVAARLNIPLLTFDFESEYRKRVLDRMFEEYRKGITPNPDILCNEEIKFGLFFEAAMKLGFDAIATGHYARTKNGHLLTAIDPAKDQSYFLHRISRESLAKSLFPIGEYKKEDVRRMAAERDLPVANKPDSQGICFVGKLDFHKFLRKRNAPQPGNIVTVDGEIVGHHDGLDGYTIGQRQGIQVSKDRKAWYVAAKDRKKNQVIIVPDRDHPLLYKTDAQIEQMHLLHELPASGEIDVVTRYHAEPVRASIESRTQDGTTLHLRFDKPIWALTPGQSAVFYHGEECLGGGFISEDAIDSAA